MSEEKARINDLLKRQTTAGTSGSSELSKTEQRDLREIHLGKDSVLSEADQALLKRQSTAGTNGEPALRPEEQQRLIEIQAGGGNDSSSGVDIAALLKRQGTAGIGGEEPLSTTEQAQLRDYFASQRKR